MPDISDKILAIFGDKQLNLSKQTLFPREELDKHAVS
jgi:hypothetical protein